MENCAYILYIHTLVHSEHCFLCFKIYDVAAVSHSWPSMFETLKRPKKKRYLQISTIRCLELKKNKELKNENVIVFLLLNPNMRHR